MGQALLLWRRIDTPGLERLTLQIAPDRVTARSTVLSAEAGGLRLEHRWRLDGAWRTRAVDVTRWDATSRTALRLERAGTGWTVNGAARPDLQGAEEPDLSVTPFCNTFPIRRLGRNLGDRLQFDTAFIDGATMTVARSRQAYVRQSSKRVRYVDLGLFKGFEADIVVDERGLVVSYASLFERVRPHPSPPVRPTG